jgi:hypothetical protein
MRSSIGFVDRHGSQLRGNLGFEAVNISAKKLTSDFKNQYSKNTARIHSDAELAKLQDQLRISSCSYLCASLCNHNNYCSVGERWKRIQDRDVKTVLEGLEYFHANKETVMELMVSGTKNLADGENFGVFLEFVIWPLQHD